MSLFIWISLLFRFWEVLWSLLLLYFVKHRTSAALQHCSSVQHVWFTSCRIFIRQSRGDREIRVLCTASDASVADFVGSADDPKELSRVCLLCSGKKKRKHCIQSLFDKHNTCSHQHSALIFYQMLWRKQVLWASPLEASDTIPKKTRRLWCLDLFSWSEKHFLIKRNQMSSFFSLTK